MVVLRVNLLGENKISKGGKFRFLTMPSLKDIIVQEGMRFLLELLFEFPFYGTLISARAT